MGVIKYIQFARKAGVDYVYFYRDFHNTQKGQYKKCEEIGNTFSIDFDGSIMPCCEDFQGDVILGNIWEGDDFRKNYIKLKKNNEDKKENMPLRCQRCRHMRKRNILRRIWERPLIVYFNNNKIDLKRTFQSDVEMIKRSMVQKDKLQS